MNKKIMIESLAREAQEKGGFNGAWLYAENGEIVSTGAVGWRDPEETLPIDENTIFQLASVTKQFTAAAVMLTIRKGLLSLDDEITKFFPELTAYSGATVRHLLTHTAGVPDYFDDADWFIKQWKEENRVPGNAEILRFLCETELAPYFAPGEKFQYSNTGYNLLAEIVERLSGMAFEEFLRENIFGPAGMKNTRCCHIRRDGVPFEGYAQATVFENGKFVADVDSEDNRDVIAFDGVNGDDYVYTTVLDMFAWDRALREEKVLTREEQALMYTPVKLNNGETAVYDEDEGMGYGLGWLVVDYPEHGLTVCHSGGMPGVNTWFERFIDADRVLVILQNRDYSDARAYFSCENGLRALAKDKEPEPVVCIEDIVQSDPDKSAWESFCGRYEKNFENFPLEEVYIKDGELYGKVAWDEDELEDYRLYPIGENTFGRKGGLVKLVFGENRCTVGGTTCKKV